jgi:hypothetical protein
VHGIISIASSQTMSTGAHIFDLDESMPFNEIPLNEIPSIFDQ